METLAPLLIIIAVFVFLISRLKSLVAIVLSAIALAASPLLFILLAVLLNGDAPGSGIGDFVLFLVLTIPAGVVAVAWGLLKRWIEQKNALQVGTVENVQKPQWTKSLIRLGIALVVLSIILFIVMRYTASSNLILVLTMWAALLFGLILMATGISKYYGKRGVIFLILAAAAFYLGIDYIEKSSYSHPPPPTNVPTQNPDSIGPVNPPGTLPYQNQNNTKPPGVL